MSAFGFKAKNSNIPHSFSITHMDMVGKAIIQGVYSYKTGFPY